MDYDIVAAFNRIEDEITKSMIRNLEHHRAQELEEGYDWSQWQVEQLAALDEFKIRNLKEYPGVFDDINSKISGIITSQRAAGRAEQEIKILNRVRSHKTEPPKSGTTGRFFKKNDRQINALIKATESDLKKGEYAMLRQANDQYRKIIFNAQMYAASGAGTYEKAVDMATKDFLRAGINCIEYKNGSRHTIKEYSEMCIKTATKRAYLTGEGEKRKEWGIHLVIMNKRGNPCPLCAKWAGKILIDDVWSGGSRADGDYPLMSEAIAAGLYHPRCRDSHSTYFGDSIKRDSTYSKKEQAQLVKDYNQEQKQKYAQTMATKLDRMSKYSLDEENKRVYDARAQEWERIFEQEVKITKKEQSNVDRKVVNSKKYHDKFEEINLNKKCIESMYVNSKKILEKADGSDKEFMCVLDAKNGDVIMSTFGKNAISDKVGVTKEEYNIIRQYGNEIVTIHNHSRNGRPSFADIYTCFSERQISVSIIICHDGDIYVIDNINRKLDVAEIMEKMYNEQVKIRLRLSESEDIPKDIGEHIVAECKVKAATELYKINKKEKYFSIRRI